MGYYGPMGYGMQFPANQLGGPLKLWGKRGYGLTEVWVKRGLTVLIFHDCFTCKFLLSITISMLVC
jgi:GMP synthase-like glutamine amidotransferase